MVTGGDDGAKLWQLPAGDCVQHMAHEAPVSDVSISSSGKLLLTLSGGKMTVWHLNSGRAVWCKPHAPLDSREAHELSPS